MRATRPSDLRLSRSKIIYKISRGIIERLMSVFEFLVLKKYGFSRNIAKMIVQELDKSRWNDFKKKYPFVKLPSTCLSCWRCKKTITEKWVPNLHGILLCFNCAIWFVYPIFKLCENGEIIKIRRSRSKGVVSKENMH